MDKKTFKKTASIVTFLFAIVLLSALLLLVFLRDQTRDATVTYWGAILGGGISGVLTLFGVLYTLSGAQSSENARTVREMQSKREAQVNHVRLLRGEIMTHKLVLKNYGEFPNPQLFEMIDDSVWQRVSVDLSWMDDEFIETIIAHYAAMRILHITGVRGTRTMKDNTYDSTLGSIDKILDKLTESINAFKSLDA